MAIEVGGIYRTSLAEWTVLDKICCVVKARREDGLVTWLSEAYLSSRAVERIR